MTGRSPARHLVAALLGLSLLASFASAQATSNAPTWVLGTSCGGSPAATPTLGLVAPLSVGSSTTLIARNLRAPAIGFLVQGWDDQQWGATQLPLVLNSLGLQGCRLYVRPDARDMFQSSTSFRQWTLTVPPLPKPPWTSPRTTSIREVSRSTKAKPGAPGPCRWVALISTEDCVP